MLGEILQADVLPTVRLNEIFRQAQKSMIVQNAHRIVEGQMPIKGGRDDDFFMIESTGLACQRLICDLVSTQMCIRDRGSALPPFCAATATFPG